MMRPSRTLPFALLFAALQAQAAVEVYTPGGKTDPQVRTAAFLAQDLRHFSAATELLQAEARVADPAQLPADFRWLLAENYLSFGQRERAEAIYRDLAATSPDPLVLSKARLRLAEFEYQRGYIAEARATLMQARELLPESLLPDWQDQLTRVLLAQARNSEAVQILTEPKNDGDQNEFTRYNLGVALINDGRVAQGRTVLDRLGRLDPTDEMTLALRDRANVTLGWNFLKDQQGASAKPVLRRVRIEGPFSNRALLGLGWAEMAPGQGRQTRAEVDEDNPGVENPFSSFSTLGVLLRRGFLDPEEYNDRAGLRNFRRTGVATVEEEALQRALVAWLELIDRDPQDPAVQEAWLAIPFALERIGAHTQAMQYYEQAATRLETARERAVAAIASVKTGRMVETIVRRDSDAETGWTWELKDLPDAPETYYLQNLIAEHRFAEALKNYRDVRMLLRQMDDWKTDIEKLRQEYSSETRGSIDPRVLFARAKQGRERPREGIKLTLAGELSLSAPGLYDAPLARVPLRGPELRLAELPQRFEGSYEKLGALKQRMETLRPALASAGAAQGRLLQNIAIHELEGQKTQIEKYLVECRFALARLYDRSTQSTDVDEYEIVK